MSIDLLCMFAFFYGFWKGYNQGIISTVFNVLAILFGVVLAFKMSPVAANILERAFNSTNPLMFVVAFVVNISLILFILRATARAFEGIFKKLYLGIINQALGGTLMGLFGVVVFSVLLWFSTQASMIGQATLSESRTYPYLKEMPGQARAFVLRFKPVAEDVWGTSTTWMDRLEKYGEEKTGTSNKNRIYELPEDGSKPLFETDPSNSDIWKKKDNGSGIEE